MLADARRGRFDVIVCWNSDRLSRGMYPAAALMEVVEAYQIREERAITLFVSGRITEVQLDDQRKFITERLESAGRSWTNTVPGRRAEQDRLIRWRPTSPLSIRGAGTHAPPYRA